MSSCCDHCKATEEHFGPKIAQRDLERYRSSGPIPTTRLLLEGIEATELRDGHLLDVGGGIGVLHHELLGGSVVTATHVEAASAYNTAAQQEDVRRGQEGRVRYFGGDVIDLAAELPTADLVTLDRVICCYPAWEPLVRVTAELATRVYAFSVPHNRWYVRVAVALENLTRRVRGNSFRTFVHPVAAIERLLGQLGFRRRYVRRTFSWHIALYERSAAS